LLMTPIARDAHSRRAARSGWFCGNHAPGGNCDHSRVCLTCSARMHAQGGKATHLSATATLPTPTAAPDMDAVQDSELRVSVERTVVWAPRTASTRTSQDLTEAEVRYSWRSHSP